MENAQADFGTEDRRDSDIYSLNSKFYKSRRESIGNLIAMNGALNPSELKRHFTMQDLKAIEAIIDQSEGSSVEEHAQEETKLEDQINFTCKYKRECYQPVLNYMDILFGPEIVDQSPKILSQI